MPVVNFLLALIILSFVMQVSKKFSAFIYLTSVDNSRFLIYWLKVYVIRAVNLTLFILYLINIVLAWM
jgi:hypothetical protein